MVARSVIYFLVACHLLIGSEMWAQAVNAAGHELSVSISKASCNEAGVLQVDWRITNAGKVSKYIYSTFLNGPSAAYTINEASQLRTIWTTLPKEADYAVNDYAPAQFTELKPGAVIRGNFRGQHEKACFPCDSGSGEPIDIVFAVAVGPNPEALEAELRRGHYVHPANPIVRWQQIVKSRPVRLQSCKVR